MRAADSPPLETIVTSRGCGVNLWGAMFGPVAWILPNSRPMCRLDSAFTASGEILSVAIIMDKFSGESRDFGTGKRF